MKLTLTSRVLFTGAVMMMTAQVVSQSFQLREVPKGDDAAISLKYGLLRSARNVADTVPTKTDKPFRMKKSPTLAVLMSAVLPGSGQIYNQDYWKAPVIWGLVGYFGYEYFRLNNSYKDYRDLYEQSQTPEDPNGDPNLKTLREFYRDQRNDFVWYFAIVYTLNLLDAYIGAHLFDFDVREDKLKGGGFSKTASIKLNLNF
jgi:hypothetical protein